MGKLKYYYDLMSQPSRALYILLKSSGTEFEQNPVALRKFRFVSEYSIRTLEQGVGIRYLPYILVENRSDDYKNNVNRFQKVPCIVHNNFKLSESVAILRYLAHDGKISENLYPTSFVDQAKVDEYLEWQHLNTRAYCAMYFLEQFLKPKLLGMDPNEIEINSLREKLNETLDIIENVWLKDNKFLVSEKLTAADVFGACEILQTYLAEYDPTINRPRLKEWLERVKKSTNPHFDEAHSVIYKFGERFGKAKL